MGVARAKREHKFQLQLRSARRQSSASDSHRSPRRPDPDSDDDGDDDDDEFLAVDADGTVCSARSNTTSAPANDLTATGVDSVPSDDDNELGSASAAASNSRDGAAGASPVEVPFGADLVNWGRGDHQPSLPATLFRDTHRFWAATNDTDSIVVPV